MRTVLIGAFFVVAGCKGDGPATPTPTPAAPPAAFVQAQQAWRVQRVQELTAPDGWTSLVGLHWLGRGAHYAGSGAGNGIRLAVGPEHFGMFDVTSRGVRFVPARDARLTIDDAPARATVLRADDDPAGPSLITFDEGKGRAAVIRRGDRYALRVKHAEAPTRTGFRGLSYWPGGPDWVVDARYVANPPGRTIEIANIVGTVEPMPNPGHVEFERDGRSYRIEALDDGSGGLFLVFADRTSGHGSYGAGRFIDAPAASNGRVRVDFNQAYNPPCAFTPFATCPLPPPENRLDLAVSAGERAYVH
ncbi:MAG TPA: DUF1684 domain-containing protein [Lysobacter sp.]